MATALTLHTVYLLNESPLQDGKGYSLWKEWSLQLPLCAQVAVTSGHMRSGCKAQ